MVKETDILHETANLYLVKVGTKLELRLNGTTHSVVIGSPQTVEAGKRVMDRLERYPENVRDLYKHR